MSSTKLEKLNKKQEVLIPQIRDNWLDRFFNSGDELDIEAFKKGITFIYSLANLKDPIKVYVDSPLGLQYACQILKKIKVSEQVSNQVWNQVGSQVKSQVWNQVSDQVRNQVSNQVWNQVSDQVNNQVWNQVWNQVSDQVWNQVRNQVIEQVGDRYESFAGMGLGQDSGWVSFYDFFINTKIINHEKFDQYKEFIKSGVYDTILFNNFAIGCRRPNFVSRDEQGRMHNDTRSAVSWRDGFELYYLAGVHFEKELWQKVVSGTMTFKEILDIENTEQRLQAMRFNPSALWLESPKLINKTPRDNELYVIEDSEVNKLYDEPKVWLLRFRDPSKKAPNNWMIEEVDPKLCETTQDADLVQAYHLGLTADEYKLLKQET